MQLGFVGLGKMGGNMALRLTIGSPDGSVKGTHSVVGYAKDPNPELTKISAITIVHSLEEMVQRLSAPRAVWVMVPAGPPTEGVITTLSTLLSSGDVIIDGGNSYYKDSMRRAEGLKAHGIHFLDVGTSGGIWGRQEGYCMMVGGEKQAIELLRPILDTLAPQPAEQPHPSKHTRPVPNDPSADFGWIHAGPSGAGHFVKMVHNGVEYGLMEAYGEGFEILHKSPFQLDLHQVAQVWNRGSVIRSWLLELAEDALAKEGDLKSIEPYVEDSGEGRWTLQAAIDQDVPLPVISSALFARFASRDPYNFSARFASALRNEFGGHPIRKVEDGDAKLSTNGTAKS